MMTKTNGDDGTVVSATSEQILLGGVIAEATADAMAEGMSLEDVFETLSACLGVAAEGLGAQSANAVLTSSAMLASHGLALTERSPSDRSFGWSPYIGYPSERRHGANRHGGPDAVHSREIGSELKAAAACRARVSPGGKPACPVTKECHPYGSPK
jgi:hypothetical protein